MIRKVYQDLILRKLRESGPSWLLKRCRQYLLLQLSGALHRPLCGPALGTLMVTYRCNFHCTMCDMPLKASAQARNGMTEFNTKRFLEIISEFAALGVPGIGFTGGEPLLREDIFELLASTRRQGMIAHLNTNGWLLGDEQARRIIDIGVDSVNISLDGATAATHDRIRKCTGAFERAVGAVERLIRRRQRQGAHVRVKTVAVIDESNIDEVPEMIALSRTLDTDCIEFIPRQPFADPAKEAISDLDLLARVDTLINYLLESGDLGVSLENSPAHLRLFRDSFAGLPSHVRCRAGYNSLSVDCYGDVFPCVPWINWGKPTGNVRENSLTDLWHSPAYQEQRETVSKCRDCYLNCQTELNLLFDLRELAQRARKKK